MPGFIKTPADEKKWSRAKRAAGKKRGKENWALANYIWHKMKKSANGDRCECGCLRVEHNDVGVCNNNPGGNSFVQHKDMCRGFRLSSKPEQGPSSCIHCGHAENAHVDTRGMPGQRQVPWCNDCNSSDIAAHSFHPFMNTERGATFEELDPSSGRYHGHTGGGAGYAGKQWVHQHDGGNMPHEHFRQGVHTKEYHATGYQENVPDKLPPDIRDKDISKSIQGHTHEDDDFEDHRTGEMHFTGYHEHEMTEADGHTHGADDATRLPNGHRIYCAKMGQGPDTDRDNRCNCDAPPRSQCGHCKVSMDGWTTRAIDAHMRTHSAGPVAAGNSMGREAVPDRVPKTWARIKPKKEYPPEITARARYVPSKREAEVGKRVDTILALRHKFHGTATDRMGKSMNACVTCSHGADEHRANNLGDGSTGECRLCACDAYKHENTCVDCQHPESQHHTSRAYDREGTIDTGCDKCQCIKYREPSVGRWARERPRKIPADQRIDTALALRAKWHGTGHSIIDKSMAPDGPEHTAFPESGADLYNHMLTGHGRGTKTGWNLISGAADLENPRMRALLHRLHLADHEKSKRPFVVKAAQRLTLSKARNNTFCADCDHLASEHYREGGEEGCGHLYPAAPLREGQGGRGVTVPGHCEGFRERGEHAHYCEQAMGGKYAGQPGSQPGGKTKCTCPRSEEERATEHTNFGICDCGHAYEAHHWPKVGKQENFCNRGGCNCNGYKQTDLNDPRTRDVPEQLPSDIRDMKIDKSHDGGPGPAWDIHTTNEWHGPDCALTEGKRGGVKFHVERWRRNGATKTWKTRPGEFRIPIKNGLRNYGAIDHTDHLYYHPADRCPEEARHETALQVRATDRLPSDIANMTIDKSRSTYPCANCDQPFKTRAQLAAHQREEEAWARSRPKAGAALTLSGPRYCRECKADLTGMKAVDIGMHMGGHPEGRRAVITGLKAGYGDMPERARQEPANGAKHRSVPCAFGSHEMCENRGRMTRRDRPKVLCDCRCHPQVTDKLPDDIRDMDIEKSMHSAGCRSRLVSPCTDEKHGGVDNHCWTAHPLPSGGPCDCGGIKRAADRARATLGLQLPERLSPTGRTPNRLPASIRNMSIEKGRRAFCPNCGHMRCADKCADCPSCAKGVGPIGSVEVVSPKSYGPVGAWCKAPSTPDTCHNLGHGLARARATGWAEDDEGWRYGLCSRHVKRPDEYHATMKITGPSEKVNVPDRLPKDFGKSGMARDGNPFVISARRARLGLFWHGTPSGEVGSGDAKYGLHIGTKRAALQALNARIGTPTKGNWDGKREYGKTPLGGRGGGHDIGSLTGYNSDHKPGFADGSATYSDSTKIPLTAMPNIVPVRIAGPMTNSPFAPHDDFKANGMMQGQKKRGTAKRGYYYRNRSEDEGTVSAVVPDAKHVLRLRKSNDYCGADSDESPEVAEEKLHDTAEASSPREFASTCKKRGSYSGLLAPSGTVYAKPGYQEHENMIDGAHMQHDYHGLVNGHGWARLSTKGANMNIDFNHDVMSRDTASRLHQIASLHGRVNGWTCYGKHRGGWEYGRDGASLAEHLEEEAAKKSLANGQQ